MATKAYVGNLPYSTTENELSQLFEQYGVVKSAKIILDRETGRSKGFAFVEMDNADDAINSLNNFDFNGRQLRVNEARERERSQRQY